MSYREIPVAEDGPYIHVGASNFQVTRPALAGRLSGDSPVVKLRVTNQLVTADELRRLADLIDQKYARRSLADTDTDPYLRAGGTD